MHKRLPQLHKLHLPSTLGRLAFPGWQFPKHLQALEMEVMELLTSPDRSRLILQVPVRHGKSIYCSHILPSWYGMIRPNANVGVISYGGEFSCEWGSRNRELIREWGPRLTGVGIDTNTQARGHFRLAPPFWGDHRAMGIGGGLAGKGFDLLIADDLIKEFSEIATEEARDTMYRKFHGELLNRMEPGGKIIVIMSRRHPDDLSGRLQASNVDLDPKDRWKVLTFPAISEAGEALWPERFPIERLLAIKRDYEIAGESYVWHGLYQQDAAQAAELCEWPASYWKEPLFYTDLPKFTPRFTLVSLDPSKGKDARKGDFSALLLGLVDPEGTLWIDDPVLVRMPVTDIVDLTVAMMRERRPGAVAIEVNGFQEFIAQEVYKKAGPLSPIYPYENMRVQEQTISAGPGKGKEVDIRMLLTPLLSRHQLRIRDTPQGRILAQQLRDFPLASHDDGPDSLSMMVRLWRDLLGGLGTRQSSDVSVFTN